MPELDKSRFEPYVREVWSKAGIEVGEVADAPYQELVKARDGFRFGLSVHRQGTKARAGIWFRPGQEGLKDLAALRNHYQQTLQRQNRFVRISSCGTELGAFFLFWEATAPLPQEAWNDWVALVEECNERCFDSDALDLFLA